MYTLSTNGLGRVCAYFNFSHCIKFVRPTGFEPVTVCLEGRCSIQLSYERMRLPATSSLRSIVSSILRFGLRCSSVRRPYMGLVKTIAIAISALTTIDAIQRSPVLLGLAALSVLIILLFVVSLFDFHIANIVNCWGGGT